MSSLSPMKTKGTTGRNMGTPGGLRGSQTGFDNMMTEQDRLLS